MNKTIDYPNFENNRIIITKITMLFFIGSIILRTYSHSLPFQLNNPVLIEPKYNIGYILFVLSGLARFFSENDVASFILSFLIITLPFILFLYPKKNLLAIIFSISWIFMTAMQGAYGLHISYILFSIILTVPFCVKDDKTFSLIWEGLRYYGCWIYASTFIFKIINGALFQWDYGSMMMTEQTLEQVYWSPQSWHSQIILFFNQYPTIVNIAQKIIFCCEGFFIVGFFTKKYDKILLLFAFIIFITITLFMLVFFVENLFIYLLIFTKPEKWNKIQKQLKKLNLKQL